MKERSNEKEAAPDDDSDDESMSHSLQSLESNSVAEYEKLHTFSLANLETFLLCLILT